jgi:hypothetical protein
VAFLHRLAGADVFWSTADLTQVALIIALVLEGRTAQEDYERLSEEIRRWEILWKEVWYEWKTKYPGKLEAWREQRDPAGLNKATKPDLSRLIATQPDSSIAHKRGTDVAITVYAVAALAAGTVIARLVLLPATYAGPVLTGFALAGEVIGIVGGLVALITVLTRRMFVRQLKARAD